jgi:hypothetical protein
MTTQFLFPLRSYALSAPLIPRQESPDLSVIHHRENCSETGHHLCSLNMIHTNNAWAWVSGMDVLLLRERQMTTYILVSSINQQVMYYVLPLQTDGHC